MPEIDRDKLRARLRKLGDEDVFYLLDEAIDLLPPAQLATLVSRYIDVKEFRPDPGTACAKQSLLADTQGFDARSRAGHYYESFNVNSRNCMETSAGTRAFIADCRRLLDRCVAAAAQGEPAEPRASFELIFALLRYIDECHDDVIFFADEGGSWQVGVDWAKVFPAWFRVLSLTAAPEEFAQAVLKAVDDFAGFDRDTHFATARKLGTADQRRALDSAVKDARS
ncbi:MAG TPA: hypothetical protein VF815_46350 [Myxococcaceae bacterium]